ncbi:MAG: zinc ABC transporter substrate-binding protein [Nitrososphaerales archaeon]|jgi:zinc/manganese transport system substrate-binding protein
MPKTVYATVAVIVIVLVSAFAGVYALSRAGSTTSITCSTSSTEVIQVVAAENFWGSLVSQLGGIHVNVTSIVSNPNIDPHEYESNAADARSITDAQLVIVNGAGYDTWALDIISAENTPNQRVLNVQELINQSMTDNPHFWYSPYYVNDTVAAMYRDLVCSAPAYTAYFHQQYANLNTSLWQEYMSLETQFKQKFGGAPVASTESIFVYMANATGLDLVSPAGFMEAVSEGNDPSAQDVATMEQLMMGGNSTVRVLVYNSQTVTPLTEDIESLAAQNHIPTIGVTETMQPTKTTFQLWMGGELDEILNALNASALGK